MSTGERTSVVPRPTYDTAGPSSALPIVFVHGSRVTPKMWLPQMAAVRQFAEGTGF
jgi:hypothetical protein